MVKHEVVGLMMCKTLWDPYHYIQINIKAPFLSLHSSPSAPTLDIPTTPTRLKPIKKNPKHHPHDAIAPPSHRSHCCPLRRLYHVPTNIPRNEQRIDKSAHT